MSNISNQEFRDTLALANEAASSYDPATEFKKTLVAALNDDSMKSGLKSGVDTSNFDMSKVRPDMVETVRRNGDLTGEGLTPEEQFLLSVSPDDLARRFPDLAARYSAGAESFKKEKRLTTRLERTPGEAITDGVAGTVGTAVSGVGQLAALSVAAQGAGIEALTGGAYGTAQKEAGVAMSQGISGALDSWNQATQSDVLQQKRKMNQLTSDAFNINSEYRYNEAVENGDSPITERLKQVGEQAMFEVGRIADDKAIFAQEVVESLGSLGTARVISGAGGLAREAASKMALKKAGVEVAGKLSARQQLKAAALKDLANNKTSAITKSAKRIERARKLEWPVGLGAMSGSSAFESTVSEIDGMTHAQLSKSSQGYKDVFNELVASGIHPQEASDRAKARVSANAGLLASAIAGTISMPTALISKLGSPEWLKTGSGKVKDLLMTTVIKEPIANFIQESATVYGSNVGVQQYADPDKDTGEGVASAGVKGAFAGTGMAAALGVPQLISAAGDGVNAGTERTKEWKNRKLSDRKFKRTKDNKFDPYTPNSNSNDVPPASGGGTTEAPVSPEVASSKDRADVQNATVTNAQTVIDEFSNINTEALYEEGIDEFNASQREAGNPEMTPKERQEVTQEAFEELVNSASTDGIDTSKYTDEIAKTVKEANNVVEATEAILTGYLNNTDPASQKEHMRALIDLTAKAKTGEASFKVFNGSPQFRGLSEAAQQVLTNQNTSNVDLLNSTKYGTVESDPNARDYYTQIMEEIGDSATKEQVYASMVLMPGSASESQITQAISETKDPDLASVLAMQLDIIKSLDAVSGDANSTERSTASVRKELMDGKVEGSVGKKSFSDMIKGISQSILKGDKEGAAAQLELMSNLAKNVVYKRNALEESKNTGKSVPHLQLIPGKNIFGMSDDAKSKSKYPGMKYVRTPKGQEFYNAVNQEAAVATSIVNTVSKALGLDVDPVLTSRSGSTNTGARPEARTNTGSTATPEVNANANTEANGESAPETKTSEPEKTGKGGPKGKPTVAEKLIAKYRKEMNGTEDPKKKLGTALKLKETASNPKVADKAIEAEADAVIEDLRKQGYESTLKAGDKYSDGMGVLAEFREDPNLPEGSDIILKIVKPQINRDGVMVQSAELIVSVGTKKVGEAAPNTEGNGPTLENTSKTAYESVKRIKQANELSRQSNKAIFAEDTQTKSEKTIAKMFHALWKSVNGVVNRGSGYVESDRVFIHLDKSGVADSAVTNIKNTIDKIAEVGGTILMIPTTESAGPTAEVKQYLRDVHFYTEGKNGEWVKGEDPTISQETMDTLVATLERDLSNSDVTDVDLAKQFNEIVGDRELTLDQLKKVSSIFDSINLSSIEINHKYKALSKAIFDRSTSALGELNSSPEVISLAQGKITDESKNIVDDLYNATQAISTHLSISSFPNVFNASLTSPSAAIDGANIFSDVFAAIKNGENTEDVLKKFYENKNTPKHIKVAIESVLNLYRASGIELPNVSLNSKNSLSVDGKVVNGIYAPRTHSIVLNDFSLTPMTMLHELLHGLTARGNESLKNNPDSEYAEGMNSLIDFIMDKLKSNDKTKEQYGSLDVNEMMAEMFNPVFLDALYKIKVTSREMSDFDTSGNMAKLVTGHNKNGTNLFSLLSSYVTRALAWVTNSDPRSEKGMYSLAYLSSIIGHRSVVDTAATFNIDVDKDADFNLLTIAAESQAKLVEKLKEKGRVGADTFKKMFKGHFSNDTQGSLLRNFDYISTKAIQKLEKDYDRLVNDPDTSAEALYEAENKLLAARSTLAGIENPIDHIEALIEVGTLEDLIEIVGEDNPSLKHYDKEGLKAAYKPIIESARAVAEDMQNQLKDYVAHNDISGIENNLKGKFLIFTKELPDGTRVFNDAAIEAYALASVQWVANDSTVKAEMHKEEIEELTGVSLYDIPFSVRNALNAHTRKVEVNRVIARKAQQYLGLVSKDSAMQGTVQGAFGAMADTAMRSMENLGLTQSHETVLKGDEETGRPDQYFYGYGITDAGKAQQKGAELLPNLLDLITVGESSYEKFVGENAIPKVPTHQINNKYTRLSKGQKTAVENSNNIKYYVNMDMFNLVEEIGMESFAELLGIDLNPIGIQQIEQTKGQLQSLYTAWEEATSYMNKLKVESEVTGKDVTEIPVRFAGGLTRVSRLQLLGRSTPQSNKLMRHLFLPTQSHLNGKDKSHIEALYASLAQSIFEEKIGLKDTDEWVHSMRVRMDSPHMQSILNHIRDNKGTENFASGLNNLIDNYNSVNKDPIEKNELGLFALMEYAKIEDKVKNGETYQTSLYVEQDGINNGILNAMMVMGTNISDFNHHIEVLAAGGVSLSDFANATELFKQVGHDIYGMGANNFTANYEMYMNQAFDSVALGDPAVVQAISSGVTNLLHNLHKGFNIASDESVSLDRSAVKYRFVERIYGSGLNASSKSDMGEILDVFYGRLEKARKYARDNKIQPRPEHLWLDELDTVNGTNAEYLATRTINTIIDLNNMFNFKFNNEGESMSRKKMKSLTFEDWIHKDFTVTQSQFEYAASNVKVFYTAGVRSAIEGVLGGDVLGSMELLQETTNLRSNLFAEATKFKIEALLAQEGRSKDRYISADELSTILKDLSEFMPELTVDGRNMLVAKFSELTLHPSKSNTVAKSGNPLITSTTVLGEGKATNIPLSDKTFSAIGVGALANVNISLGDAKMIENLLAKELPGILHVFDGINLPLHSVKSTGERINKAQADAWNTNPMEAVSKMAEGNEKLAELVIDMYHDALGVDGVPIDEEATLPWYAAKTQSDYLQLPQYARDVSQAYTSIVGLRELVDRLSRSAAFKSVQREAMNATMLKMGYSSDQMSAMNTPYTLKGTAKIPPHMTLEQVFRSIYDSELEARVGKVEGLYNVSNFQKNMGLPKGSSLLEVSGKDGIKFLLSKSNLSNKDRIAIDSLPWNDSVTVLMGSPAQMVHRLREAGVHSVSITDAIEGKYVITPNGESFILIGNRATTETISHELHHHSTFRTILDVVDGPKKGRPSHYDGVNSQLQGLYSEIKHLLSGKRIRKGLDENVQESLSNLEAELNSILKGRGISKLSKMEKAKLYDEMLSWSRTNKDIRKHLSTKKTKKDLNPIYKRMVSVVDKLRAILNRLVGKEEASLLDYMDATYEIIVAEPSDRNVLVEGEAALNHRTREGTASKNRVKDLIYSAANKLQLSTEDAAKVGSAARLATNAFSLTSTGIQVYKNMYGLLLTPNALSNSTISQLNKLRANFFKEVSLDDFVAAGLDENAYFALANNSGEPIDRIASLLALHHSSDAFTELLGKVQARQKTKVVDYDTLLSNAANRAVDVVTDIASKQSDKSGDTLIDVAVESGINTGRNDVSKVDGLIEGTMDRLEVGFRERISKALDGDRISNNALSRGDSKLNTMAFVAGQLLKFMQDGSATDKIIVSLNRLGADTNIPVVKELLGSFRSLAKELSGRTLDNAGVYDMIKKVTFTVDSVKKKYKEVFPAILRDKFSSLSETEDNALTDMSLNSGLAGVVHTLGSVGAVRTILDTTDAQNTLGNLTGSLSNAVGEPSIVRQMLLKVDQLVRYNLTSEPGHNLLQNADAIASNLNYKRSRETTEEIVNLIQDIIAVKSAIAIPDGTRETFRELYKRERKAVDFLLKQMAATQDGEYAKEHTRYTKYNSTFGYMPSETALGRDVRIDKVSRKDYLESTGYTMGESINDGLGYAYFYTSHNPKATFGKGIIQIINKSINGVSEDSGSSINAFRQSVVDPVEVITLRNSYFMNPGKHKDLIPLYSAGGEIYGFDRVLPKNHRDFINKGSSVFTSMGTWQSRQIEEGFADAINADLAEQVAKIWEDNKLTANESSTLGSGKHKTKSRETFVDITDPSKLTKVERDAVNLIPPETIHVLKSAFGGNQIMIRKDMLMDIVGRREASISDIFTGNTDMNEELRLGLKSIFTSMFGKEATKRLLQGESVVRGTVDYARHTIVIGSVIVPAINMASSFLQLGYNGVSLLSASKSYPAKLKEVETYVNTIRRDIELRAQLRITPEGTADHIRLSAELQSIEDTNKSLSIWPLIEAGELNTIADLGIENSDGNVLNGQAGEWLASKLDQLPEKAKGLAKQGLVTKDTALYKGMEKVTLYGDFIAKAVLFDKLVQRDGMTEKEAIAYVSEEFVNYDRLSGRTRNYLENVGLLWFWNFKLRSVKATIRAAKKHPLRSLLFASMPIPGDLSTAMQDNILVRIMQDRVSGVGPGMVTQAVTANPYLALGL